MEFICASIGRYRLSPKFIDEIGTRDVLSSCDGKVVNDLIQ